MQVELRYSHHPDDFKGYDTARIRKEFLLEHIFVPGEICLTYSMYDRFIVGGAMPVHAPLMLETFDALKAPEFLHRRELGIINVGGEAEVMAGGVTYRLGFKEALYLGKGLADISFDSIDPQKPAKLYMNSAPAHHEYPSKKVTVNDAEVAVMGSEATANHRTINKLLINSVVETCGLQMGLTSLHEGSVWNTMPPHTHSRRMEVYFYFDEKAVISPSWSIHSAAGTSGYSFIWGMTGENLDYGDMDIRQPNELK
jgi:4-deoxy-L-threo-5-hexosulose-uronate ketol-isomerase